VRSNNFRQSGNEFKQTGHIYARYTTPKNLNFITHLHTVLRHHRRSDEPAGCSLSRMWLHVWCRVLDVMTA